MDMAYLDLWATIVAILVTSLIWRIYRVRCHRFDRYNALHKKYARLVNDLDRMTYEEAGEINQLTLYWDFPFAATSAMSFALFKTYAVPTISRVLNMSDELASSALAARRAEDTAILLIELHTNGLDSVAGSTALARINYLHSRYGKLITRDDLLYTLSLFVFEPVDFLKAYEWRELSALEVHARYVYWREIGARMGIADIPLTLEDLRTWSDEYAERATLYDPDNSRTAEATIAVLTAAFPGFLKPLAKQVVLVFLDERVRTAFGWQPAFPSIFYTLVPVILRLRAFVMGYLLYPRTKRPAYTQTVRVNGKYMRKGFFFEPWYVQTGASSFGQAAYVVPGGPQWQDEGFRHCSLGPARLARTGVEETVENATMMRERAAVCPFFI